MRDQSAKRPAASWSSRGRAQRCHPRSNPCVESRRATFALSMLHDMHVSFALFADAANLSQEGKLNVLGVFDALQVASLPAIHPRAHLVVHLKGTGADMGAHSVAFRWLSPAGQELWSSSGDLNVGAPPP